MDKAKEFIQNQKHKLSQLINTRKIIIETLKDEKIELLERVVKLQDTIDSYKDANKRLKTRNRKLAKEMKEIREKKEVVWKN